MVSGHPGGGPLGGGPFGGGPLGGGPLGGGPFGGGPHGGRPFGGPPPGGCANPLLPCPPSCNTTAELVVINVATATTKNINATPFMLPQNYIQNVKQCMFRVSRY